MPLNPNRDSEMERLCVRLFRDDTSTLRRVSEVKGIGFNQLIRQIIKSYCIQITARERQNLDREKLSTHRMDLNGMDDILEEEEQAQAQKESQGFI